VVPEQLEPGDGGSVRCGTIGGVAAKKKSSVGRARASAGTTTHYFNVRSGRVTTAVEGDPSLVTHLQQQLKEAREEISRLREELRASRAIDAKKLAKLTVLTALDFVARAEGRRETALATLERAGMAEEHLAKLRVPVAPVALLREALLVSFPRRPKSLFRLGDAQLELALKAWSNLPGPAAQNMDRRVGPVRVDKKYIAASALVRVVTGIKVAPGTLKTLWSDEEPRRKALRVSLEAVLGERWNEARCREFG
jgi:hypothetical protein